MKARLIYFRSLRDMQWQWVNEKDVILSEETVLELDRKIEYVPPSLRDFLFSHCYRAKIPADAPEPYAYIKRPFSLIPFITRQYYGCGSGHAWANGVVTYFNVMGLSLRIDGRGSLWVQ